MTLYFPPLVYVFFLLMGTIMTLSSQSIFGMWLGMEINLMSFMPIITNLENNKKSSEAAIKYFIIQVISSTFFLLFCFLFYESQMASFVSSQMLGIITVTISFKLGMAPLHFWFPEVLEGLNWSNSFIMLTWQKVAPLFVISILYNFMAIILFILFSSFTGAISGLNQTSLRKILAFSSISHMSWMGGLIMVGSELWINYLSVYFLTSFIICLSFWYYMVNHLSQLLETKDLVKKFILFINLLSLAGLPPLLGFLPKFMAIDTLLDNIMILFFLIFFSLVTLYFYTRLGFSVFTLSLREASYNFKEEGNNNFMVVSGLSLLSLLGFFPLFITSK
uniref:NADH-ubiquinone oxidoreductase chain 2 n=1 Tax=Arcoscalpellum epeeum TaxID=2498141 RepID=A0A3S9LPC5_9CRUS|nr:NADH dehydrogenase subunit 2 [Arcoscalpellum epeeum]